MIVYLLGYMGSGKTTLGKKLAARLKWEFIDLDSLIEEQENMAVSEIFSEKGESYFREIEASKLRNIRDTGNMIISCGGGTPCFNSNMEYMLSVGHTIYLKLTPAALKSRLERSKKNRPLIKHLLGSELQSYLEKSLEERELFYNQANKTVEGLNPDINLLHAHLEALAP